MLLLLLINESASLGLSTSQRVVFFLLPFLLDWQWQFILSWLVNGKACYSYHLSIIQRKYFVPNNMHAVDPGERNRLEEEKWKWAKHMNLAWTHVKKWRIENTLKLLARGTTPHAEQLWKYRLQRLLVERMKSSCYFLHKVCPRQVSPQ